MKIFDILDMGFRNLLRRKTRTFLTVIGVVVGAAAIIIMLSLGIGMDEQLERTIAGMGDLTIITLQESFWSPPPGGEGGEWQVSENVLDADLVERLREWDGIVAVTPMLELPWQIQTEMFAGRHNRMDWVQLVGIDASFIPYMGLEVASGDLPQADDRGFALFGRRVPYRFIDERRIHLMRESDWNNLWNPDFDVPPRVNVLQENLYLRRRPQQEWNHDTGMWEDAPGQRPVRHRLDGAIGVLEVDGRFEWGDPNEWMLFVDYRILQDLQREHERAERVRARDSRVGFFSGVQIKVEDIATAERVMQQLRDDEGILLSESLADIRDGMRETQEAVQMLLGGIGAISLLVAAIGIANTMFMSIYERTKEIGVMKVLGCPLRGIQSMFLFEASIIGFLGGIIGMGVSIGASVLMNEVEWIRTAISNMGGTVDDWRFRHMQIEQGDISVIPLWLIIAAIGFSTLVGLISGYLPARRATKISALEAIRNE